MKTDDQKRRRRAETEEVEADQIVSEEPSADAQDRKPGKTARVATPPRRVPPPPPPRR